VPPGNAAALAEAIVRYFAEDLGPGLREGVRALGATHSWDALADNTIALVDALAPARGWR